MSEIHIEVRPGQPQPGSDDSLAAGTMGLFENRQHPREVRGRSLVATELRCDHRARVDEGRDLLRTDSGKLLHDRHRGIRGFEGLVGPPEMPEDLAQSVQASGHAWPMIECSVDAKGAVLEVQRRMQELPAQIEMGTIVQQQRQGRMRSAQQTSCKPVCEIELGQRLTGELSLGQDQRERGPRSKLGSLVASPKSDRQGPFDVLEGCAVFSAFEGDVGPRERHLEVERVGRDPPGDGLAELQPGFRFVERSGTSSEHGRRARLPIERMGTGFDVGLLGPDGSISTVLAIARKVLMKHLRKRYRMRRALDFDRLSAHDFDPRPSSAMARRGDKVALLSALRSLPLRLQIPLELYYWESMTAGEIAKILEIAEGTARTRIRTARLRLAATLAGRERVDESRFPDSDSWAAQLRAAVEPATPRSESTGQGKALKSPTDDG